MVGEEIIPDFNVHAIRYIFILIVRVGISVMTATLFLSNVILGCLRIITIIIRIQIMHTILIVGQ